MSVLRMLDSSAMRPSGFVGNEKRKAVNFPAETETQRLKRHSIWGWPLSLVVKSGALCFGCLGSVPRCGLTLLVGSRAVVVSHIQNRGRLAQMLAQRQSSSSKKRKIGNRCQLRVNLPQQKTPTKNKNRNKTKVYYPIKPSILVWEKKGVLIYLLEPRQYFTENLVPLVSTGGCSYINQCTCTFENNLSNMVAARHMLLFKLTKLNKIKSPVPQSLQPHFKCSKAT